MVCFRSLRNQRKGGLGDKFRGFVCDELMLPIATHCCLDCRPVGVHACGGMKRGSVKGGRACPESFVLKSGHLGEILGGFMLMYRNEIYFLPFSVLWCAWQMALIGILLSPWVRWFKLFTLWLARISTNLLLSSVPGLGKRGFTRWLLTAV